MNTNALYSRISWYDASNVATNAFGMGVDVNDVQNVYHYAVSGNLMIMFKK